MDNDNYLGDKIEYYVNDNSDDKTGKKKAKKIRIIFHGTIGLYNYSLGIACFIQETYFNFNLDKKDYKISNNKIDNNKIDNNNIYDIYGISGGCYPAILLGLDLNIRKMFCDFNLNLLDDINKNTYFGVIFSWYKYVKKHTLLNIKQEHFVNYNDPEINKNKKLHIYLTNTNTNSYNYTNWYTEIINKWDDIYDLIQCVLCSGFIPFFGINPLKYKLFSLKYKNNYYIDGSTFDYEFEDTDNTFNIYPHKWRDFKFYESFIFTDTTRAQYMFDLGFLDAKNNKKYLDKYFL